MNKRLLFGAAVAVALTACGHKSAVTTQNALTSGATAPAGPVVAAAGTTFYGKLSTELGSKISHLGDQFTITQTDTLLHKDAALHGAAIDGHVAGLTAAGPMKKAAMDLVFDDIRLADGTKEAVDVTLISAGAFDPKSHHLRTIGMMIGGAMAAKHLTHGHSMLGAVGGYAASQALKTDIVVKPGTTLELRFNAPVASSGSAPASP